MRDVFLWICLLWVISVITATGAGVEGGSAAASKAGTGGMFTATSEAGQENGSASPGIFSDLEQDSALDTGLIDQVDFGEVQRAIDSVLDTDQVDFKSLALGLIRGEKSWDLPALLELGQSLFFAELGANRRAVLHIIIIAVAAAFLNNFVTAFGSRQISEIAFYMIYLLLMAILIRSFTGVAQIVTDSLHSLITFMRVLIPAYFLVLAASVGTATATFVYQIILFLIYVVDWLMLNLAVPVINIYVALVLVNNVSEEAFLSKMAELLKTIVNWMLKSMIGAVIGINIIQNMIAPFVDAFKMGIFSRASRVVPGVGNAVNAVTELVIGSGIIIKNGIGAAALVVLALLCLIPYLKMVALSFLYKLTAAVIQPVSDKRAISSISGVGEGIAMLTKILLTCGALFMVTVAIVTVSTNHGV